MEDGRQLRQVIINTHSPAVVNSLPPDTLVVARRIKKVGQQGQLHNQVEFAALPETWRTEDSEKDQAAVVTIGELLAYLTPDDLPDTLPVDATSNSLITGKPAATPKRRLRDYYKAQYDLFEQLAKTL